MKEKIDTEIDDTDIESNLDSICNIDPVNFFTVKELCYYKTIDKFYKICSNENITKMIDIIDGKSNISLRILDWFVTKYSKKKIDCYTNKEAEIFDVRISYKSQLKSYKKRYFDPFRRRKKFVYYFNNTYINTTLGQLNFFKWAFSNNILIYVDKNLKHISKEMNIANKEDKKKKNLKIDSSKDSKDSKDSIEDKIITKTTKIKHNHQIKISSEDDSIDNIKINAIKTTENDEINIILKFD